MDKSLMRECFHNCLDVAPREDDFLVPSRYTPMQCAFYDKIPYASFMGLKARMSAGITLEFDTNAPAFTLQWKLVGGYPLDSADRDSTLDVYVNDVLVAQQTHLRSLPGTKRWNPPLIWARAASAWSCFCPICWFSRWAISCCPRAISTWPPCPSAPRAC